MNISKIIYLAKRKGRIKNGRVLCDNCDNPASKSLSQKMSWTGCAPCFTGEAASLDFEDVIALPKKGGKVVRP
jgi:hypothetical protein